MNATAPYPTRKKPRAEPSKSPMRSSQFRVDPHREINEPFLFRDRGSPAEYGAGLKLAIDRGWLKMHELEPSSPSRRPALSCSSDEQGKPPKFFAAPLKPNPVFLIFLSPPYGGVRVPDGPGLETGTGRVRCRS